ncbi:conserved hypothetical protein [Coccidioides posadasii str. Silveira]|uniref:Uncharacterized protein n=1 Tax=Coccidioides posadasii (strain RMSCC 757 / Silveira) TaxID=443226 RepID=E9D5Q3_COCPS|nr:conserved hypothetical protein [Coccidioides posadasii str. Silveira]
MAAGSTFASQGFGIFIPKSPFPTWSACTQPTTEYSATKGLCAVVTPEAEPRMRTRAWIEMDPSRRVNQGYQHKHFYATNYELGLLVTVTTPRCRSIPTNPRKSNHHPSGKVGHQLNAYTVLCTLYYDSDTLRAGLRMQASLVRQG